MKKVSVLIILISISLFLTGAEFNFDSVKDRVSEFTLSNGLKFVLLEDHSVPIASFVTYANAGGSDERIGIYGISHFLEHLAFKGTSEVGTNNYKKEREILTKMDRLFELIRSEKNSLDPDKKRIAELEKKFETLRKEAQKYVVSNEFDSILKKNGGVGLNAGTGADSTVYFFSLPSNKIELWAYLESGRFSDPVFREFYKEREVIKEERRVRVDNQPVGKMIEELLALAFKDHPYKANTIGPMSNINNITRYDVKQYFRNFYTAGNMIIGVTGDVYPEQLKKLAEKYFSKIPPGIRMPRNTTIEPPQLGEKRMTIYEDSQPWIITGYHCPSILHEDFVKFSVLDYIMTNGRSSRLYKKLVTDDKSALFVGSMAGFPGNKYPSLYIVFSLPNMGHTTEELEKIIGAGLDKLKTDKVTEEELKSAKVRMKVALIKQMTSNKGLLSSLLSNEILTGSWENAFTYLQKIEKVTADDLKKLAEKYFILSNRIVIKIEKKGEKK
ncbi:MAG: insulinase family protein [Candidatus Aminicenantes bacterium]|nr:insulinase family protein [Candidatus Aminicenantes bacterium]